MRPGRRPLEATTRAKLLELWTGEDSFGRPLGCVTTSFTFDAELFEEQCLARFLSIHSNPNETAKTYLVEREEKLSQCFSCVLVDRAHAAPDRSLRWNLLPVSLPGGGVLHAKLTLLVWEHFIRVLVGSANLTEPAYRRNQEVVAVLDFGPTAGFPPALLRQCVSFLYQVRTFAPGFYRSQSGPQAALTTFLKFVESRATALPPARREDDECSLVPLVPGGASVIDQIKEIWKGSAPDQAWVLSPFYDEGARSSSTADRFASLLTTKGKRDIFFTAPGRTLPAGTIQVDIPEALKHTSHPSLAHGFSFVEERVQIEGEPEERPLHAKAIWLQRAERALYMLGSSNFTAAGLGLHRAHNIELNVAYSIKDSEGPFGKLCARSWPEEIELDQVDDVQFLDGPDDSSEASGPPVLPAPFGSALFTLAPQGARLELEIGADAPNFEICAKDRRLILDYPNWLRAGKPSLVVLPWEDIRPPSSLAVRWTDETVGECEATWIVNAADMSALPPLEELGNLSLAELMEILSSARPLHEVVSGILKRREKRSAGDKIETDPHRKVDTSQFLLQRMRRVARALEGMRKRLEQPVGSADALHWRLQGPIGPIALAKRLAAEDPAGAAFMISEVAATLRDVAWQRGGSLQAKDIKASAAHTIQALRQLAADIPVADNLARYVAATFEELTQ